MKNILPGVILTMIISLAVILSYSVIAESQSLAPDTPHGKAGFENCQNCHNAKGIKPAPANHASFTQETCLSCHAYASAQQPAEAVQNQPADTPGPAAQPADNSCLSCHSNTNLKMTLANGEELPLFVDSGTFSQSIHGNKLLCTDCHSSITGYPHQKRNIVSLREYSAAQYELCKQCHFANYTKSLDSVHYQIFSTGGLSAPLCTDCHGAHNVSSPDKPRANISTTCSKCHESLNNQYIQSVHGKALIEDDNYDVPVCTDCHRSHTIEDPRTASFRIQSVELCSNCHANEKLMKKYDISTNVVQSYLQDFHGSTVALMSSQSKDIWVETAVCTDCHGVHDIKMVNEPDSPVIKANLAAICAGCHPNSGTNFPGAWLSHYEPSISRAPAVFLVQWFYRLMIPFVIVGLCAHILLDIWRAITNR